MKFRIVSFNVNGLRSYNRFLQDQGLNFNDYLKNKLQATVLCVQESRGSQTDLTQFHTLTDYVTFSSLNNKNSGKYGVSTFIKKDFYCSGKISQIQELKDFDGDGRYILTKHGDFDILNCYFPYLAETTYRSKEPADREKIQNALKFYYDIGRYLKRSPKTIILGDFNACYNIQDTYLYFKEARRIKNIGADHKTRGSEIVLNESDLQIPDKNITSSDKKENFSRSSVNQNFTTDIALDSYIEVYQNGRCPNPIISQTELPFMFQSMKYLNNYFFELPNREWTYKLIYDGGFLDTFRLFSQKNEVYTCWNQILNLRRVNLGTRIDLILIPKDMRHFLTNSNIFSEEYGSDHCPVYADFEMLLKKEEKNILNRNNNLLSFFKKKK
ncbi:Apurinic/apyrimidinic endonuclease [Pseudoloma neurophilia]|uniref:Apurinic/apyrimidinic endonuclease n=1 Tax=Pseudoloma neurophilia TaxID=146866 RepID=A0A0R0LWH3_9MICR|nr:Apurinic/apyrimidinic endonuclease [Pseudoloma neurophilia]